MVIVDDDDIQDGGRGIVGTRVRGGNGGHSASIVMAGASHHWSRRAISLRESLKPEKFRWTPANHRAALNLSGESPRNRGRSGTSGPTFLDALSGTAGQLLPCHSPPALATLPIFSCRHSSLPFLLETTLGPR
jgi:hypothetical protein